MKKNRPFKQILTALSLASLLTSFGAYSQSTTVAPAPEAVTPSNTSSSSVADLFSKAKDSKFGLRVETQTVNVRNGNSNERYDNLADVFLSYTASSNKVFYLYPRFLYTKDKTTQKYTLKDDQIALRFDYLNILDEKEGAPFNFTTSTKVYGFATDDARKRQQTLGYFRQDLVFNKKFTENFSVLSDNRFYLFAPEDKKYVTDSSRKYFHDIFLVPQYTINDKFSTFLELWHRSKALNDGNKKPTFDQFQAKLELDYNANDSVVLGTALIHQPFMSHDGKFYQGREYQFELNAVYSISKDSRIIAIADFPITTRADGERNFSLERSINQPSAELDLILTAF